jgi:hypothetical protein
LVYWSRFWFRAACGVAGLLLFASGEIEVKLDIDWSIREPEKIDLDKFRRYLRDHGHRQSTIDSYLTCISIYLKSKKSVQEFLDELHSRKLAGSTIDNYITSIKKYNEMIGQPISIPYLKKIRGNSTLF